MRKTSVVSLVLALSVTAIVLAVFWPASSHASIIIRSKSNISNNRTAGGGVSGPGAAVLLCSSCTFAGMAEDSYLVLMDSQSGEIWGYSDDAVVGKADAVYIGTLQAVGKRIIVKAK